MLHLCPQLFRLSVLLLQLREAIGQLHTQLLCIFDLLHVDGLCFFRMLCSLCLRCLVLLHEYITLRDVCSLQTFDLRLQVCSS